jgi:hypothetical protein
MEHRVSKLIGVALIAGLMGACANDGSMIGSSLTTSSVDPSQPAKTSAAKVDPACNLLSARIDALRKEGVVERAEKVSSGTSSTVSVKRASLAKLAELDKANAEFQSKCSTVPLPPATQAMAPAAATSAPAKTAQAAPAAQAQPAATTAVKKAAAQAAPAAAAQAAPAVAVTVPATPAVAPAVAVQPAPGVSVQAAPGVSVHTPVGSP